MKSLKIKSGWLPESGLRMDASYHLGDGPISKVKLKRSPFKITTLEAATDDIFKGNIFKRCYVNSPEKGYPFLSPSDMMKADINSGKYVSKKYTDTANLILKKGWILVSRSGTLGNVVFTNDEFEGMVGSDDLIRILPNNKKVLGGYLYAYLASKYGYALLTQSSYGGVVKHIEPHHIKDLPIPILPYEKQKEINDLIVEAAALRVEANGYLNDAIIYLENKIGLSKTGMGFQVNKIKSTHLFLFHKRLDSQYNIIWKKLNEEQKDSILHKKISDLSSKIYVGGRGKRMYVKKGTPFLSSSEMMLFNPIRGCKMVSLYTYGIDEMKVSKYDILLSRSGTVGNTIIVGNVLSGTAISEHALRVVIDKNKISPNYVFCFLKTKYGIRTMEASSFGSVIITLNEDLIGNIELPILPENDQKFINDKIESYITKMDDATKAENHAINLIEKEIESWQE